MRSQVVALHLFIPSLCESMHLSEQEENDSCELLSNSEGPVSGGQKQIAENKHPAIARGCEIWASNSTFP